MLLPGRSSLAGLWGSLASLTLCIHGFPGAGAATTTTTQQQPPEISSSDGLLDVTLTVDLVTSLDGTRVAPGYNGGAVGPTLRASPGDTVRITLVNDLPAETAVSRELYDLVADPGADPIEQTRECPFPLPFLFPPKANLLTFCLRRESALPRTAPCLFLCSLACLSVFA